MRLSSATREAVVARVRAGEEAYRVAVDLGLSEDAVQRACRDAGVAAPMRGRAVGRERLVADIRVSGAIVANHRGDVRSRTESIARLPRGVLRAAAAEYPLDEHPHAGHGRPETLAECDERGLGVSAPCPYVSCRHHLYVDVNPDTGAIRYNFPDREPWELAETCSLRVAAREGEALEEVGRHINLTRERVRQIETRAIAKATLGVDGLTAQQVVEALHSFAERAPGARTVDPRTPATLPAPVVRRYLPVVQAAPPPERPVLDADARALAATQAARLDPRTWLRRAAARREP